MFRNYLAAALRNLVRNKLYAAINIVGLAVGLAAALLIGLFVRDEFSYDTWIPGYEQVYAVHTTISIPGQATFHNGRTPTITAELLAQDFPEIGAIARFGPMGGVVRRGDIEFRENITWADPDFFKVLPLPAIAGNLATALQQPDGVVLTRSMARKYFGRDNPIGQTLEIGAFQGKAAEMRVTAVLEDLPSNTELKADFVASARNAGSILTFADKNVPPSGEIARMLAYLRLAPGASIDDLRNALPTFEQRHPRFHTPGASYSLELVPMAELHFHPAVGAGLKPLGNITAVYGALSIALLIVAIASINFVNLTTARATRRAVEVGVRKVSGAERRNLIVQFIGESMIYAVLGMALAIVFTHLLLPSLNGFLQRTIAFDYDRDPRFLGALFMVILAVGILAGAYPALVLSRFSPASVLTGSLTRHSRGGRGRQILVALQFMILMVLALCATTVTRQVHFATNEALRFDSDQVLAVALQTGPLEFGRCDIPFSTLVRALPGVRGAACGGIFGGDDSSITAQGGMTAGAHEMLVDFGFFDLLGIKPVAGRAFSRDFGGDLRAQDTDRNAPPSVVINETLSRALGFATPQSAVGQSVRWRPAIDAATDYAAGAAARSTAEETGASQIVGVVPDFANGSVREATFPEIFWVNSVGHTELYVKLQGNQVPETLAAIDQLWKQVGLPGPIRRIFLDQVIENMYRDITLVSEAVAAFTGIAVFVACLGLFGLATFAAESRTKEIGVRKALGASRADVLRLVLWEFNKPVLVASLIAWPIAYLIMRRWLEGFAERVDIGLWMFPLASVVALAIAILTVAGHALLVARTRPGVALRYE